MNDPFGYFKFLEQQISEGIVVEDEVDLAKLAALVPELCDALEKTLFFTDLGSATLAHAKGLIEDIVPKEQVSLLFDGHL